MGFRLALVFCLLGALPPASIWAQEFRASIAGQVFDPSRAPIPGAVVTALQVGTNQSYTAKTNADGIYSVDFIPPGQFIVTVEAPRFIKKLYPNVTLEAGQKLSLDVGLALGAVEQTITVSASPGLLDSATASGGGVLDQTKIDNMPSTGRRILDDVVFVQGVFETGNNDFNSTPRAANVGFSINGSRTAGNSFFVNGAPVSTGGNSDFIPSQDAVQELQISVSAYDATVGPGAAGVFNTVLKSGVNKFHGDLFEYYGNAVLNANFWSSKVLGQTRPVNTRSTYGATVGGPIVKNKTFFFFSYEGFFQHEPANVTPPLSVPTVAMRSGNFAGSGYTVYDPSTVTCVTQTASGCSTYGRSPFPNDTIPQSSDSPIGQAILNLYPIPNIAAAINNYVALQSANYGYNQYIGRIDQNFSASTRLYGMFSAQSNSFFGGNAIPGAATQAQTQSGSVDHVIVDLTHVLSPALVMDLMTSFSRSTWPFTVTGTAVQQDYKIPGLNMPFIPTTPHQDIAPTVAATNYASLFGNTANGTVVNYWYLSPSLSQVNGRHMLRYGFSFMNIQSGASGIPGSPNGSFTFSGTFSQQNPLKAASGSGSALADLLLGYPSSGSLAWNTNSFVSYHYYAGYVQDDFKLRSNVSLNFGLRWDATTSPIERHNGINGPFCFSCVNPYDSQINHALYPSLPNPLTGGLTFAGVGSPRGPYSTKLGNWQPRIGIAWSLTPKTVFRAGFGIFYSQGSFATTSTGYSQTTSYISSLNGNVNPTNYFLSGNPYPNGVLAPAGASGGLTTSAGTAITYNSPAGVVPWMDHWSIGFQRALPKQILLDLEYVGSHTHPINVSQPWDVITSAQQAACLTNSAICNTSVPNPFYGVLPAAATLGAPSTVPAWELARPFPLFNGVAQSNDPAGYSVYNALQARFERKIKSLDFVGAYSYANTMSALSYLNAGNFRDAHLWYGPDSTIDVRHMLRLNVVLPLPVGEGGMVLRNAKGLLGALLNHWVLASGYVYRSGLPLSVPSANLTGTPGCTSYLPEGGQTPAHWFNNNESCYQTLAQWQPRTSPLYISYLTNPLYWVWTGAMQKSFALPREGVSATLRAECLNCSNNASGNITNPDTTLANIPTFAEPYGATGFGTTTHLGQVPRQVIVSLKIKF